MQELTIYGRASLEALRIACVTGLVEPDLAAKAITILPQQAIYLFLFALLDGGLVVYDPAHTTAATALPFAEWWNTTGAEIYTRHYPLESTHSAA